MIWHAPAVWADDLCKKLTRNMTYSGWGEWVSKEIDYVELCLGLPIAPDEPDQQQSTTIQGKI